MTEQSTRRKRGECSDGSDEPDRSVKKLKMSMGFDTPDEALNDVCVIAGGHKFYVLKGQLARQSDYFRICFFGNFEESNKNEFVLKEEIDPQDFQYFLELINCKKCLTDDNIAGVCHLADMFVAELAQVHCRDYLIEKSRLTKNELFQLTVKYFFLTEIKASIIAKTKTMSDIEELVTSDLDELDVATSKLLIKRMFGIDRERVEAAQRAATSRVSYPAANRNPRREPAPPRPNHPDGQMARRNQPVVLGIDGRIVAPPPNNNLRIPHVIRLGDSPSPPPPNPNYRREHAPPGFPGARRWLRNELRRFNDEHMIAPNNMVPIQQAIRRANSRSPPPNLRPIRRG